MTPASAAPPAVLAAHGTGPIRAVPGLRSPGPPAWQALAVAQARVPISRRTGRRPRRFRRRHARELQEDDLIPNVGERAARRDACWRAAPGRATATIPLRRGAGILVSTQRSRQRPDHSPGGRAGQRADVRVRLARSSALATYPAMLAALVVSLVLVAGCASPAAPQPHPPLSPTAETAPSELATTPVTPSPAASGRTSRGDDAAVLATARAFVRALLTYSYRRPDRLPPLNRVGSLITHGYATRLQPRQALDPELAQATRESSTVHLLSALIARDAPRDATTCYATIAYVQTLDLDGRRESVTRIWQIRLLRFSTSGWRVDDVTQAS